MNATPSLTLSAAPTKVTVVEDVFRSDSKARRLIEHPPVLRPAGFDMDTGLEARIVRGEFLEAGKTGWKVVRAYPDGVLVATVPGDDSFLCWASRRRETGSFWDKPKINPIALVEFVYSFCVVYAGLIELMNPPPESVRFRVDLKDVVQGDSKLYLTPYGVGASGWMYEATKFLAPESEMFKQIDLAVSEWQAVPGRAAYLILERIYTWFGAPTNVIPYVTTSGLGQGAQRAVDPALIINDGRQ